MTNFDLPLPVKSFPPLEISERVSETFCLFPAATNAGSSAGIVNLPRRQEKVLLTNLPIVAPKEL